MHRVQALGHPWRFGRGPPATSVASVSPMASIVQRSRGMEDIDHVTEVSVLNIKMILKHFVVKRKRSSKAAVSKTRT